jgi:hypothetical protein
MLTAGGRNLDRISRRHTGLNRASAALAIIVVSAITLVLSSCSSSKKPSGEGDDDAIAALITKEAPLTDSEREQLQDAVMAVTADHVYTLTNTVSATVTVDVQWGADGRIAFRRTWDTVHDTGVDPPRDGIAVATHHYTYEPLKVCTGEDRGEKVVIYDTLFGNEYVSLDPQPIPMDELRIAIDDPGTTDLGWDPSYGARAFAMKVGPSTATTWITPDGNPDRTTSSLAPKGFFGLIEDKEPRETMAPLEGLTPPECFDPNLLPPPGS